MNVCVSCVFVVFRDTAVPRVICFVCEHNITLRLLLLVGTNLAQKRKILNLAKIFSYMHIEH